jgi:hypothetical protein
MDSAHLSVEKGRPSGDSDSEMLELLNAGVDEGKADKRRTSSSGRSVRRKISCRQCGAPHEGVCEVHIFHYAKLCQINRKFSGNSRCTKLDFAL